MDDFRSKGPRSNTGARSGRSSASSGKFGAKKPYRESGSSDKKFGDKKPYGDKKFGDRKFGDKKPYGEKKFGDKKPYGDRKFGDRPYTPRPPRDGGQDGADRPYRARAEGERASRPYTPRPPREGSERPYSPRPPREGGDRPYRARAEGERSSRPYTPRAPREGGDRPYRARTEGDRPARPYSPREGGDRKPYAPRGERPYTPRPPRDDAFSENQFGEGRPARFSGKRETKNPRNFHQERIARETNTVVVQTQEDGWLVGYHAVYAALASGRRKVRNIWLMAEAKGPMAELLASHPEWPIETRTRPEFEAQFGEAVHQGVAALVGNLSQPSLPELLAKKPRLLVALDQVTDPHNLGAIVRSCAAFGAEGVIVTEHHAAGLSATAAKVAAGAMETVPVVEVTNLVQALNMLKETNFTTIGLAGEAPQSIHEATQSLTNRPPVCLVVGSEGEGLRRLTRETCDTLVQIPISPTVESLNVSVATGVALSILTKA